ncbi:MAG: segregation/condensation protein A [Lachnospiraceae bacterium]|nr:segregation/condensation protein A [Lachnospiraceae bacterium]
MPIPLKLQVFEGPMDLLMHLIEKNKIDIYDIPIVTITDQYLEYVRQMEHDDMNVTSEFLVMAATLLDIKSRMLLPRDEDEDSEEGDPRDELVRRLLEYKMFKYMSEELREKNRHAGFTYFKPQDLPAEVRSYVPPLNYEELIGDRTAQSLQDVFRDVLKRKKSRVDPIRSGFGKIQREEISVADKQLYVRAYLENHPHADFREMLELENSREEIIVTFLVILELMKSQKIRITQDEAFGRIWIDLVTPGEETEPTEQDLMEQDPMESDPMGPEPLEQDSVEPELMEQDSVDTEPMADPEPEPAVEPEPTAELKLDLIADPEPEPIVEPEPELIVEPEPEPIVEPEPEPIIEAEPEPVRRHLITRPRQHMTGPGRHAFPITAKKMRKDKFRLARGNRIWKRRKHLRLHLTSRKGT